MMLHEKGTKTVLLITTGCSAHCTVLLAVSASGEKLKHMIVFKGKLNANTHSSVENELRTLGYPEDTVYCVQEAAWCDSHVFTLWVEKVWAPCCKSPNNEKTMFLMDRDSTHVKCKDLFRGRNTIVTFIPEVAPRNFKCWTVGSICPSNNTLEQKMSCFFKVRPIHHTYQVVWMLQTGSLVPGSRFRCDNSEYVEKSWFD
jgi:DDE superfamily endonuclease